MAVAGQIVLEPNDERMSLKLSSAIHTTRRELGSQVTVESVLEHYTAMGWKAWLFNDLAEHLGVDYGELLRMVGYNYFDTNHYPPPTENGHLWSRSRENSFYLFLAPESQISIGESTIWHGDGSGRYVCKAQKVLSVTGPHLLSWLRGYDSYDSVSWHATEVRIEPELIEATFTARIDSSVPPEIRAVIERQSPVVVPLVGAAGDYLLAFSE